LVFAASITSHTSIPIFSNSTFSSFTSAMFTARYVFSRIFAASATSALDTGTTRANAAPYSALASSPLAASIPPTTLGISAVVMSIRPGSSRSGLNPR
jgi:hypothetical protein